MIKIIVLLLPAEADGRRQRISIQKFSKNRMPAHAFVKGGVIWPMFMAAMVKLFQPAIVKKIIFETTRTQHHSAARHAADEVDIFVPLIFILDETCG